MNNGLFQYIAMYEFFGSFCFVFGWLVLRNYNLGTKNVNRKLESFIKSILVTALYEASVMIGHQLTDYTVTADGAQF